MPTKLSFRETMALPSAFTRPWLSPPLQRCIVLQQLAPRCRIVAAATSNSHVGAGSAVAAAASSSRVGDCSGAHIGAGSVDRAWAHFRQPVDPTCGHKLGAFLAAICILQRLGGPVRTLLSAAQRSTAQHVLHLGVRWSTPGSSWTE